MKELNNLIICGDCLDIMPQIPDKSVDMILCDLPYEVLHKNNPHVQWDRMIPFEPLWAQYERIIKDNGAIVLFAQGMFTAQLMMSNPKMWKYNLIWEKGRATGFLNANRMPLGLGSIIDYEGDKPVISMAAVRRYVLEKRPSLSRRKWHIEF